MKNYKAEISSLLAEFSLNDLLIFKEVYELKNYSAAAVSLKTSTSTISRKIKHLEVFFETNLFIMKKNVMYRSTFAESLYKQIINHLNPIVEQICLMKSKPESSLNNNDIRGTFKIQLPIIVSRGYITPKIPKFLANYPNLKLEILYSNSAYEILSSNLDICLTLNRQFADNMQAIHIEKNIYGELYCTKEYIKKYGTPKNLDELKSHNLVGVIVPDYTPVKQIRFINADSNQIQCIDNPNKIRTNNSDQNLELILSNEVIAPLINLTIKNTNLELVHILPEWKVDSLGIYVIINQYSNKYIINIIKDFLLECLSEI
ncbi:MAG: LysR family transcriptional regulator [Burkholderiales bacterium]|nr:LysR family transcriptional regulator [Burkholderiales bacterium]